MLKILLAAAAVVASWLWLRAFFSRAIDGDEKLSAKGFAVRAVVFIVSVAWFFISVFGMVGGLFGWLVLAVVVGFSVKMLAGRLRGPRAEPAATDPDPSADS